jgi:hypothetical protein
MPATGWANQEEIAALARGNAGGQTTPSSCASFSFIPESPFDVLLDRSRRSHEQTQLLKSWATRRRSSRLHRARPSALRGQVGRPRTQHTAAAVFELQAPAEAQRTRVPQIRKYRAKLPIVCHISNNHDAGFSVVIFFYYHNRNLTIVKGRDRRSRPIGGPD